MSILDKTRSLRVKLYKGSDYAGSGTIFQKDDVWHIITAGHVLLGNDFSEIFKPEEWSAINADNKTLSKFVLLGDIPAISQNDLAVLRLDNDINIGEFTNAKLIEHPTAGDIKLVCSGAYQYAGQNRQADLHSMVYSQRNGSNYHQYWLSVDKSLLVNNTGLYGSEWLSGISGSGLFVEETEEIALTGVLLEITNNGVNGKILCCGLTALNLVGLNTQMGEFSSITLNSTSAVFTRQYNELLDLVTRLFKSTPSINVYSNVRNFISYVLSAENGGQFFGGRDQVFYDLNTWLLEPGNIHYRLLLAEAGRGKTTLLVRWYLERAKDPQEWTVLFVPISVRFKTDDEATFLLLLASQLATVFEVDSDTYVNLQSFQLKALCVSTLARVIAENKKVLLVIDGLDEANGWTFTYGLLPFPGANNLKVLLSSRELVDDPDGKELMLSLGWPKANSIASKLLVLKWKDLEHILQTSNLTGPVDNELTNELYRITEGDPLLINLYISYLSENPGLDATDLMELEPGIKGLIKRWFEDQKILWGPTNHLKEKGVQKLLNHLAIAKGPLTKSDLQALDIEYSSFDLGNDLDSLKRFIIGDGYQTGYSFSHPRIGYYFRDNLADREKAEISKKYLQWGLDELKKADASGEVSAYLLNQFRNHLKESGAEMPVVEKLINQRWLIAHNRLSKSFSGFLNDVKLVRELAREKEKDQIINDQPALYLSQQVLCLLCSGLVRSYSGKMSPQLLAAYFQEGLISFEQTLEYCSHIPNLGNQISALLLVLEGSTTDEHREIICMAIAERLNRLDSSEYQIELLRDFFQALNVKNVEDARYWTEQFPNVKQYILQLVVFPFLSGAEQQDVLNRIYNWEGHSNDNEVIHAFKILPEKVDNNIRLVLLKKAYTLSNPVIGCRCIVGIAPYLNGTDSAEAICMLENMGSRQDVGQNGLMFEYLKILPTLAGSDRKKIENKLVDYSLSMPREWDNIHFFISLVKAAPSSAEKIVPIILEIGASASNILLQAYFKLELLKVLPTPEKYGITYQEILQLVNIAPNSEFKSNYALELFKINRGEKPASRLGEIFKMSMPFFDSHYRIKALSGVFPYLSEATSKLCIEAIMRCIRDISYKVDEAGQIPDSPTYWSELTNAVYLVREILPTDYYSELIGMLDKITDGFTRAYGLSGLLDELTHETKSIVIPKIEAAIDSPRSNRGGEERNYSVALKRLMPHISLEKGKYLYDKYKSANNEEYQLDILLDLAYRDSPNAVSEALKLVAKIPYSRAKFEILSKFYHKLKAGSQSVVSMIEELDVSDLNPSHQAEWVAIILEYYTSQGAAREKISELLAKVDSFYFDNPLGRIKALCAIHPYLTIDLIGIWERKVRYVVFTKEPGLKKYPVILRLLYLCNNLPDNIGDRNLTFQKSFSVAFGASPNATETEFATKLEQELGQGFSELPEVEAETTVKLLVEACSNLSNTIRLLVLDRAMQLLDKERHFSVLRLIEESGGFLSEVSKPGTMDMVFNAIQDSSRWWTEL